MADEKKKLVIIDGNAILHRAFHALPPFTTKDGVLVNAVYGFTTTLLKIFKEINPSHIAVAFDKKGPTFRHLEYKEYKAKRVKKPEELYAQLTYIKKILEAMNIPYFEAEGYEADDIIATLTEVASKSRDMESGIVTGDMDTLQLVSPKVKVYAFKKGLSDLQIFDEAAVIEKYNLPPGALIDFKALRGDPSDNIPGVRGIGEVMGSKLIKKFDSVEKLYEALEKNAPAAAEIPQKTRDLLIKYKKDALLGKKLVELVKKVPIKFSLFELQRKPADYRKIITLLWELGFQSLVSRFEQTDAAALPTAKKEKIEAKFEILRTEKEALEFLKRIKAKKLTLRSDYGNKLLAIAAGGASAVIINPTGAVLKEISDFLARADVKITGHDLKQEFHFLNAEKIEAELFDAMIASYAAEPGSRAHELGAMAFSIFGLELSGQGRQQALLMSEEERANLIFAEISAITKLREHFEKELKEKGTDKLFREIEMPLVPVLYRMEKHGIKVDVDFLKKMSKEFERRILKLQEEIFKLSGVEFNINSPLQLGKVLFETLKISAKAIKKTATGAALSTAASELEKLRGAHPIIELIFEYRELAKLKSTYIDALPGMVNKKDGRVHTTFNQAVTATGRLSSSNPNLQNIPAKTELGRDIRKAFVAESGSSLVAADYSQMELRIAAHLSGDKAMLAAFRSQEDIHTRTAELIWGAEHNAVTKEMRRIAKAINFGIIYGMGPKKLAENASVSFAEARDFIDRFFVGYSVLREYLEEVKALAAKQGYVETMFGRRRYIPEITSGVPALRAEAERQAVNTPIQGTQADIIKIAMNKLADTLPRRFGNDVSMIVQVHDELVFEARDERVHEAAVFVREVMENTVKLKVPIAVEIDIGKNWGEMRQWK